MSEEVAFLNALIFYSKQNYFRTYTHDRKKYVYHESNYWQKPFTQHCMPLCEKLYLAEDLSCLFRKKDLKLNKIEKKSKVLRPNL